MTGSFVAYGGCVGEEDVIRLEDKIACCRGR
jgi:hypothetical protein